VTLAVHSIRSLILDDVPEIAPLARGVLAPLGVHLSIATSTQDLQIELASSGSPHVLIINATPRIRLSDVAKQIRQTCFRGRTVFVVDPDDPCVRRVKTIPNAECLSRPALALLPDVLTRIVAELEHSGASSAKPLAAVAPVFHGIVGRSKQMLNIFSIIEKVAASDTSVYLEGDSGTGKELIARAVHFASPRCDRPLVTLDCVAIPEGLMESHLFGHVKGAFTGATENREGVFSLANHGTLFMDELSEMKLALQGKLLRVLQSREFSKVGSSTPIHTDIRLVTASNKDLLRASSIGTFREDLYFRVGVVVLKVPPLRERPEDIPLLVDHFLRQFTTRYHKPSRRITPSAMDRIVSSPWPGNVRQLQNCIEQAIVLAEGEILRERDFFGDSRPSAAPRVSGVLELKPGLPLREVERRYILRTLNAVGGSRTVAAKHLGISLRSLQYKLKTYSEQDDMATDLHGAAAYRSVPGLEPGMRP
jgi:DNA-binding NtrC family response regulator